MLTADWVPDTAVFNSQLSHLPNNIAQKVIPLGLPESSLPSLVQALATGDIPGLAEVPGVNAKISGVAIGALRQTFVDSFRGVWITAACFTAVAVLGT